MLICPACGSDQFQPWREIDSTLRTIPDGLDRAPHVHVQVDRCAVCGLFRSQHQPSTEGVPAAANLSVSFEASASKIFSAGSRSTSSSDELALLSVAPPAALLDVGCGAGQFLLRAIDQGYQAQGIDPGPQAVRFASEQVGVPVRLGSLDVLRGTERFNVITTMGVLEHVQDPVSFLVKAAAHLAPGGEMLIGVPNAGSLNRRISRLSQHDWDMFLEPGHLYHYDSSTLAKVADRAGLAMRRSQTGTITIRGKVPFLPNRYPKLERTIRWLTRVTPLNIAYTFGLRAIDQIGAGDMLLATFAVRSSGSEDEDQR